jgi:5-methylcytosine-specific restriction endonuclease McrA
MDTLVLNSDGAPVNYLPLSTIDWQEAIRYMVLDKASVLDWYDNWIIRSARWETPVPAVIMLREYMKPKHTVRFSKSNVFLRDRYSCQYCGTQMEKRHCTLDHVHPISQGGRTVFENTVTACSPCNSAKGNSTKMKPRIKPYRPDYYELVNKRKSLPFIVKHPSWQFYIN